jgi:hypothetical protein
MAELEEAAIDVAYEIKTLREMSGRLNFSSPTLGNNDSGASASLTPSAGAPVWSTSGNNTSAVQVPSDRDAFLNVEGLLIHFRNLIEFFYTERKEKDNLVLAHHYTGAAPRGAPPWADH